jgi:hypothetical protein
MTGVGDGHSVWGECDLTVNGGTTYFPSSSPRTCVEGFYFGLPGDDQDGLSVLGEADGSVVPFIGAEKLKSSRLFKIVYGEIFAGNRKYGLVGTELEIVQWTLTKLDMPRGSPARQVPERDHALGSSAGKPPAGPAQGDIRDSSIDWPVPRTNEDEPGAK